MPVTDPIADMLTRIRNAIQVHHESVMMPHSKMKLSIAKILKEEGFIRDYDLPRGQVHPTLRLHLTYREGRQPAMIALIATFSAVMVRWRTDSTPMMSCGANPATSKQA